MPRMWCAMRAGAKWMQLMQLIHMRAMPGMSWSDGSECNCRMKLLHVYHTVPQCMLLQVLQCERLALSLCSNP